ncbi:phosphate ABC transporter permease subunit PstC [Caldanaerobius polysaccharolyticus]|uniref:phosphate ABC transporter permease subunit PstC n=1 Tax=Caldanaerobius polysaccharolyticus TaxID=44256 RepID=UPI000478EBFB|nr:phosphate ABC transporter permease subunit PstC [Caldanaerobius polysaccharolyticus]
MKSDKVKNVLGKYFTFICAGLMIITTVFIVYFIASQGLMTFVKDKVSLSEFLFSSKWNPGAPKSEGGPYVGALAFILGSLAVSLSSLVLSTPLSISVAIFMVEISPHSMRNFLQSVVELFAGIPSVVYGWIGLSVLVPFIRHRIGGMGFSLLAGTIVLAIMIFPTITTVSVDSLRSLRSELKEASYALGATRWQTLRKVLLPAALPGILTGVVLGLARAFGEALAVQMVIGNAVRIPTSYLEPIHTMTSILTMDMGNTVAGSLWNNALWSIALLLLMFSFTFILIIRVIGKRRQYR